MLALLNSQARPLAQTARRWFAFGLDLLYPQRCGGCGTAGEGWLCAKCCALVERIPTAAQRQRLVLDHPWDHIEVEVISALRYAPPIREAIHAMKYDGARDVIPALAVYLAELWQAQSLQADFITPIPLHSQRLRERGYNQSEELARYLSQQVGIQLETRTLKRARHTQQQALLNTVERRANMRGAFTGAVFYCVGKRIMLLDDVTTSGATLREGAMALLDAGAARVSAITLARAD
jgi:competence protein ComFC